MDKEIKGTSKGTIKFFSEARGFGFIYQDNSQEELFFHVNDCIGDEVFKMGQRITYNLGTNKRGICAIDVSAKELLEE